MIPRDSYRGKTLCVDQVTGRIYFKLNSLNQLHYVSVYTAEDLSKLTTQIDILKREVTAQTAIIRDYERDTFRLEGDVMRLEETCDSLTDDLENIVDRHASEQKVLSDTIDELREQTIDLRRDLETEISQSADLQFDLNLANAEIAELREQIGRMHDG